MDRWESALEELQESQTLDSYGKVLLTAESVLKEDLAPFEFDWVVQTVLSQPLALPATLATWLASDSWAKLVRDAYKLLSTLVDAHYDRVESYMQDIIAVCELRQAAGTRSSALLCLAACARRLPLPGARYAQELAQASTCKAPLAVLVGTICEYHPDSVRDQFVLIWRNYLNLLSVNKNTEAVREALLRGLRGLLHSFGTELPTRELGDFYDTLVRDHLHRSTAAVLPLLSQHATLFRERLAADPATRRSLWACADLSALRPVYGTVAGAVPRHQLQIIYDSEIHPRTLSDNYKIKYCALRIASELRTRGLLDRLDYDVDVCDLEYRLRSEVSPETAEALSWCLEAHVMNSDKLLQTAMLYYDNLPAGRRREIVRNGLLNARPDVMHISLNLLVSESCRDEGSLRARLPVWRDLLDTSADGQTTSADGQSMLLDAYIDSLLVVLDNYLDDEAFDEDKEFPAKLSNLLTLTSHILRLAPEVCVRGQGALLAPRLARLARGGLTVPLVDLLGTLCEEGDQCVLEMYEGLQMSVCTDAALLCAWCGAMVRAPGCARAGDVLHAVEIILSRTDAEPATLGLTVERLEAIILSKEAYDKSTVAKCIRLIEKLRSRTDLLGKEARILHRDVTLFLGKYYYLAGAIEDSEAEDNALIGKIRDELTLDIPNPMEGVTYKLSLNRLLHSAIESSHEPSLRMLLNVICAKLCDRPGPLLRTTLSRVLVAACRARDSAPRPAAAPLAATRYMDLDATEYILQRMTVTRSPAVRAALADLVEAALLRPGPAAEPHPPPGPAAEPHPRPGLAAEPHLRAVHLKAGALLAATDPIQKLAGLEISECILSALKANRLQAQALLPDLTVLIATTRDVDTSKVLENSTKLILENIGLFSGEVINSTTQELLKAIVDVNWEVNNANVYRSTVKVILSFAKHVMTYTKESTCKVTKQLFELQSVLVDGTKFLYVLTEMSIYLELGDEGLKEVLDHENGCVLEGVFGTQLEVLEEEFALEVHLRFINRFAAVLYRFHSQRTLKHLSTIIERFPPKYVRTLSRHLSECVTLCRQLLHSTPDPLLKGLESWSEGLPLKDITEHVNKEKLSPNHATDISALDLMLHIFKLKNPVAILTTVSIFAKDWADIVLRIYASGHIRYFKRQVAFLTNLLSVSLRFMTVTDVKRIILDANTIEMGGEKVGMQFCRFFMTAFFRYLVKKPYLLLQPDMECCCALLNDVVKCSVRQRWHEDQLENVLELIDQVWPIYERQASFIDKHSLLLTARSLGAGLPPSTHPMQWVRDLLAGSADLDQKVAVVSVLPGREEFREWYALVAALLPARLAEAGARGAALRALLDAAGAGARCVLPLLATLAGGDESPGWWDLAYDSCMASLAAQRGADLATLYEQSLCSSAAVSSRLLVPLLRYSPPAVCQQFFCTTLPDLLERLRAGVKAPSLHAEYRLCVEQRTVLLDVLQVMFERVPAANIESPSSPLYEHIQTDKPWHAAREVIQLCYRLRAKLVAPRAAPPALEDVCRAFHQSAFKCMCACVCVRRPDAAVYGAVWGASAWGALVNPAEEHRLPLRAGWRERKIVRPASVPSEGDAGERSRSRTLTRSRVFLRTLSENPLEYDLTEPTETDVVETADVEVSDTSLNRHPCAGTLTALFRHAAGGAAHAGPRGKLCAALTEGDRNLRWLLSQAVCNSREELKPYASELRPALLSVVVDTASTDSGHALLNGLHIDILKTLTYWDEDIDLPSPAPLHAAIDALVCTALESCARAPLFRTLEGVLEGLLRTHGPLARGDFAVFDRYFDDPTRTKCCVRLLLCFARHRVVVPSLLPSLLSKLAAHHREYRAELAPLAELIGIEIANSTPEEKVSATARLKQILEEVRRRSVSDYVKVVHYSGCCDAQQFRSIVDLTLKLPASDRGRCLRVLAAFMRAHPAPPDLPPHLRDMALAADPAALLEDLLSTPQFLPAGSAKRQRVDTSPILTTIDKNERSLAEVLARLAGERVGRVRDKLCTTNMAVRLAECFYICVYLPLRYSGERPVLSVCLSEFHDLLFSHLKTQDCFKQKKLRDQPWDIEDDVTGSIRTRTTVVGTLRAYSYTNHYAREDTETDSGIDVQVTVEKVLDSFMQLAKVSPSASIELFSELSRSGIAGRGFDFRVMPRLVSAAVRGAPALVYLARGYGQELAAIDGFSTTIADLTRETVGSEGEEVFKLLCEEVRLWSIGDSQFVLGVPFRSDVDECMGEQAEFTIENMVSAFGKLSNWDDLPLAHRRLVDAPDFPPLWTDKQHFKELLDQYTDTGGWFGQSVRLFRGDVHGVMSWLRAAGRWPRRHYAIAAVTEAMQWGGALEVEELEVPCRIGGADCLAEWAARLMLRTAYITDKWDNEAALLLSRSHELAWCRAASERGLYEMALAVVRRNCLEDLYEGETLQWMEQKLLATTSLAVRQNDLPSLEQTLERAEELSQFYAQSPPGTVLGVNALLMKIHQKLHSLSTDKIDNIMEVVETQVRRLGAGPTAAERDSMRELCEIAVFHYDAMWGDDDESNEEVLVAMCGCVSRLAGADAAATAAAPLARLRTCTSLGPRAAAALLDAMNPLLSELPPCHLEALRAALPLLPRGLRAGLLAHLQEDPATEKLKSCLQLLCLADHLLLQYCEELAAAIHDDVEWRAVYSRLRGRVFDNPHAGPDFLALARYRSALHAICDADAEMKRLVLRGIAQELRAAPRRALRVGHVCPALTGGTLLAALGPLLGLPRGVHVVSIDDELSVYWDSARRPCAVRVRDSNGRGRRYLHKNECLRAPAALAHCRLAGEGCHVVPLGEDCGLIEFLEDHERVRDLVASACPLDEICVTRQAGKDEELILAPSSASQQNYKDLCSKVPARSLRSAVERRCVSVEDFIAKRRQFVDSLSDVTVSCWLFGLGDRHLHNMLWGARAGRVAAIDWGALFQWGAAELPPARLTRTLLALADTTVLVSRLESRVAALREAAPRTLAMLRLAFHWKEDFCDQLVYIEGIMRGKMAAHDVIKHSILASSKPYKEKYVELLDSIFEDHHDSEEYSVEDQVSCLLRACTEPAILAVTRTGWEPWV